MIFRRSSPDVPHALEAHDATLRRVARRMIQDPDEAEDAVQDVWLAALQQDWSRVRNPEGWLRRVLRYTALRIGRQEAQRRARELRVALEPELASHLGTVVERDDHARLARFVDEMGEPYQRVLELRYFEGCTLDEIGTLLGRPKTTVKSQLRRGLSQLRDKLNDRNGGRRKSIPAVLGWLRDRARSRKPLKACWSLSGALLSASALLIALTVSTGPRPRVSSLGLGVQLPPQQPRSRSAVMEGAISARAGRARKGEDGEALDFGASVPNHDPGNGSQS